MVVAGTGDEGRVMTRDRNVQRRTFEQAVALQIAQELTRMMGPVFQPEMLAVKSEATCRVFGDAFDANDIVDEASAARIMEYVPKFLVERYRQRAELNARLDAAVRPRANERH
jgi:hypothetical protein